MAAGLGILSGLGGSGSRFAEFELRKRLADIAFQQQKALEDTRFQRQQQLSQQEFNQTLERQRMEQDFVSQRDESSREFQKQMTELSDQLQDENAAQEAARNVGLINYDHSNPDDVRRLEGRLRRQFNQDRRGQRLQQEASRAQIRASDASIERGNESLQIERDRLGLERERFAASERSSIERRADSVSERIMGVMQVAGNAPSILLDFKNTLIGGMVDEEGNFSSALAEEVFASPEMKMLISQSSGGTQSLVNAQQAYFSGLAMSAQAASLKLFGTSEPDIQFVNDQDMALYKQEINNFMGVVTENLRSTYGEHFKTLSENGQSVSGAEMLGLIDRARSSEDMRRLGAPNPSTARTYINLQETLNSGLVTPEQVMGLQQELQDLRQRQATGQASSVEMQIDVDWLEQKLEEILEPIGENQGGGPNTPEAGGIPTPNISDPNKPFGVLGPSRDTISSIGSGLSQGLSTILNPPTLGEVSRSKGRRR